MLLVEKGGKYRKNDCSLLLTVFVMYKTKKTTKIPSYFLPKKFLAFDWALTDSFLLFSQKKCFTYKKVL